MKQIVYILSGVSGSGKSTYIKNHNLCSVSTDELVEEYARENNFNYTQAFDEIQNKKLFGSLNSIFFDNIIDLRPASPARAASTPAFSASRLV